MLISSHSCWQAATWGLFQLNIDKRVPTSEYTLILRLKSEKVQCQNFLYFQKMFALILGFLLASALRVRIRHYTMLHKTGCFKIHLKSIEVFHFSSCFYVLLVRNQIAQPIQFYFVLHAQLLLNIFRLSAIRSSSLTWCQLRWGWYHLRRRNPTSNIA